MLIDRLEDTKSENDSDAKKPEVRKNNLRFTKNN